MKKYLGGKSYIKTSDIIFMSIYDRDNLPDSLCEKYLSAEGEFVEMNDEENNFINQKEYILNKNLLDIYSYDQLIELYKNLKKIYAKSFEEGFDADEKEIAIIEHKYTSYIEYLKERLTNSCDTCINEECIKKPEEKIGLDVNGKPMGTNCKKYKNILSRENETI